MTFCGEAPSVIAFDELTLQALKVDDVDLELVLSRDADVTRFTTIPEGLNTEQAFTRLRKTEETRVAGRVVRYGIRQDNTLLGTAGVGLDNSGTADIFYALLPCGRGRGVATRSAMQLLALAWTLGASDVRLVTHPDNPASQAVARRSGFTKAETELRVVKNVEQVLQVWRAAIRPQALTPVIQDLRRKFD